MTELQFEQWKEFSVKAIGALDAAEARKTKLNTNTLLFFDEIDNQKIIESLECWEDVMSLFYDLFEEYHVDCDKEKTKSFQSQLRAAIRAGINLVTSGWGVISWFTAGDIKSMFQGEIPEYVTRRFTTKAFNDDTNLLDFSLENACGCFRLIERW